MFAAFPSTIMEAAFGRLHNSGTGAFGARSTVVESIMVNGKAANIAIPNDTHTHFLNMQSKGIYWVWVWIVSFSQVGQNPFGDYAPQSTQIQGILIGIQ